MAIGNSIDYTWVQISGLGIYGHNRSTHVEICPMQVAGSRLATWGCVRNCRYSELFVALRGSGWTRNMADSGKTSAGAAEEAAGGQPVVKTEKQLKKEAQKNAKLAKYNEKMAKQKNKATGEVCCGPPWPHPACPLSCLVYLRCRPQREKRRIQLLRKLRPLVPTTSLHRLEIRKVSLVNSVSVSLRVMNPVTFPDVTAPLPSAYSPLFVEAAWYPWWEGQVSRE